MDETSIHVLRAVQGDRTSLEWVIAHFQPLVQAQVRMRLKERARNEQDVDDIAAEVWLVALKKLHQLRPRKQRYTPVFVRFLASTSINKCNDFLRSSISRSRERADSRSGSDVIDRLTADTRDALTKASYNEIQLIVAKCLKRLSKSSREVLLLRLIEQRSNREIAQILEMTPNTAAVRYRRALQQLRECLPRSVFDGIWNVTLRST